MKKGENKEGLSRLAINFIIILLIIIIAGIIFFIVKGITSNQGKQDVIDYSTLDLKISQVQKVDDSTLDVTVKRNEGEGQFVALSFIVKDGINTEIIRKNVSMEELENETFSLNFILLNASRVKSISITPILETESGEEVIGDMKDEYITPTTCSNYCPTNAQCGVNDCGVKCGDGCSSGYLCLKYKCIREETSSGGGSSGGTTTCTDTCSSLGYTCGNHTICGASKDCGTCSTGYNCNSNGQCIATTCIGSSTQSCSITNGAGIQTRTCNSTSGTWSDWNNCTVVSCDINYVQSENTCIASTCTGSSTQSCSIINGSGQQSRNCTDGVWGAWGICTVVSCDSCFVQIQNYCVAATCTGSTTQSCSIINGLGHQSRTCSCGSWSDWGTCTVISCNACYTQSDNSCTAVNCNDNNACTTDLCSNNVCSYTPISGCCTSALQCNDNNICTNNLCSNNVCSYTPISGCCTSALQCNDNNACTTDSCSNNLCSNTPISGCCTSALQCNDNNACTTDLCSSGTCSNLPISNCCTSALQCNDNNACTTDLCSSGTCSNLPISNCCTSALQCNDNNACTTDLCSSGTCSNLPISNCCTSALQCNDNNACTNNLCSNNVCSYTPISGCCTSALQCNDNNACTTDSCSNNLCSNVPISPCCGNLIVEGTEQCDGTNLNGQTCATRLGTGYTGTLSCTSSCTFNTNLCVNSCTPETNTAFCTRLNKNCGSVTALDNCGISRTVNCGTCTSPQTCNVTNMCSCSVTSYTPALNTFCGSRSVTTNCGTTVTMTGTLSCVSPQTCINNVCSIPQTGSKIIIDHTTTNISKIPLSCINKIKSDLDIAYSHTSHGSQIYSGMQALEAKNSLYNMDFNVVSGQLHFEDYYGYGDQSGFATGGCYDLSDCDNGGDGLLGPTREFLDSPNGQDINVIMWSWCSIAGHNIPFYLSTMQTAITEYPNVKFVFITGHAEGGGEGDSSDSRNNVIRDFVNNNAFCNTHQCILFDFADMENYDPDNNYFLNKYVTDALNYNTGNWGVEYLTRHPTGLNADLTNLMSSYDCAHSSSPGGANINCALKGQAAWYMFARMVGWDGNPSHGC